jgi:phosphopantothenoylcysteine decarboxylase/phosphopantothenate--cysteine ligase
MDIIIKAAAVADYRPANLADNKIKKKAGDMAIPLARTKDILAALGEAKRPGQFLCGFSMETENMVANSRKKLEKKHLDMIAANNVKVAGAGFGVDTNILTLITPDGMAELPLMSKDAAADALLDAILERMS